jgi:serine/threonine protein kinase
MREVTLLSNLRHPNILGIYALVREPRMLVMEYAAGGSLRALLARSTRDTLPWPQRLTILAGVACGVEFLHAQTPPVIHFDLKCENIVLTESLVPRVADFGISLLRPLERSASRAGGGVGTPQYMAPEVARKHTISDYEAVDVYGFGCIMYDDILNAF